MTQSEAWKKRGRRSAISFIFSIIIALLALAPLAADAGAAAADSSAGGPAVYVIHAEQTIESGLETHLKRAYKEAEEASAEVVILMLDTFGGEVGSAQQIGALIRNSSVPTVAFIQGKAFSAGTYIALNADKIVMQNNSAMGSAAVVNGQGDLIENPKTISAWTKLMTEAAKHNGRNPDIAAAMVDPNFRLEIKELARVKERGDILALSTEEAIKVGYAEFSASTLDEVVQRLDLSGRTVIEVDHTFLEQLGQFLSSPVMKTVLLIVGIAGIAIELIVPGFGLPGIIGLIAFGLYFFAHYIIGFAGMEDVFLFGLGIIFLISELFISSFGILGILGTVSLIAGVVMASPNAESGLWSLLTALAAAAIIVFFVAKRFKSRGIWNKFILSDSLTTEEGYVSNKNKLELLGLTGQTLTPLRPAGTMQLGEERFDVVTAGEFIAAGMTVEVIKVEGTRIVVRQYPH